MWTQINLEDEIHVEIPPLRFLQNFRQGFYLGTSVLRNTTWNDIQDIPQDAFKILSLLAFFPEDFWIPIADFSWSVSRGPNRISSTGLSACSSFCFQQSTDSSVRWSSYTSYQVFLALLALTISITAIPGILARAFLMFFQQFFTNSLLGILPKFLLQLLQ